VNSRRKPFYRSLNAAPARGNRRRTPSARTRQGFRPLRPRVTLIGNHEYWRSRTRSGSIVAPAIRTRRRDLLLDSQIQRIQLTARVKTLTILQTAGATRSSADADPGRCWHEAPNSRILATKAMLPHAEGTAYSSASCKRATAESSRPASSVRDSSSRSTPTPMHACSAERAGGAGGVFFFCLWPSDASAVVIQWCTLYTDRRSLKSAKRKETGEGNAIQPSGGFRQSSAILDGDTIGFAKE